MIGVDGARGEMSTILFDSIPDETVKRRVSEYLLKSGYINGAEYFGIFSEEKVELFGIEDQKLYIENLKAFQAAEKVKASEKTAIAELRKLLEIEKDKIFSKEVRDFLDLTENYKKLKVQFTAYVQPLQALSIKTGVNFKAYENFAKSLEALEASKGINMSSVETELSRLIDAFSGKLVKEELEEVIKKNFAYRLKRIAPQDYFLYIQDRAKKTQIDLSGYPNLKKFMQMFSIRASINAKQLKSECKRLEIEIKNELLTDPKAKRLEQLLRHLAIYEDFIELKLTKKI
jgi:hypothetical protein